MAGNDDGLIRINETLAIPEWELGFSASRSSGPGGQHVNKVNSRVTLEFDVEQSPSLGEQQKCRLASRLATRINRDGMLKLHAQKHRSQAANRAVLVERFAELLAEALKQQRRRRKTRPSAGAKRRRLKQKKRRSDVKKLRSRVSRDD